MAADYWNSTQHLYWEDPTADGTVFNEVFDAAGPRSPLPESRLINIYLQQQIFKLGKRLNARQPVLATAIVFVRRFYSKVDIQQTNPYMIIATSFYLACKIEECPHHIKLVVSEARGLWQDMIPPDTAKLGQCEFRLVSEINAHLIVHHPYKALKEYEETLQLTQEEITLVWSVVNDHYVTDLCLRYPPFVVALAAVILVLTLKPTSKKAAKASLEKRSSPAGEGVGAISGSQASQANLMESLQSKDGRLKELIINSEIDLDSLKDCTQQMISLYVLMERYNEKECRDKLTRLVHSQSLEQWAG